MTNQDDPFQTKVLAASELPDDKKIYFNGMTVSVTPMDCSIVLQFNNQPVALVTASHTVAKSLAHFLNSLLDDFGQLAGQSVTRIDEVQAKIEAGRK